MKKSKSAAEFADAPVLPKKEALKEGRKLVAEAKAPFKRSDELPLMPSAGRRARKQVQEMERKRNLWKYYEDATHCLQACLAFYHGMRSGKSSLMANANLEFMPCFFATSSLSYQTVAVHETALRKEMPEVMHDILFNQGCCLRNALGVHDHANMGFDECVEARFVKDAEGAAKRMSIESVKSCLESLSIEGRVIRRLGRQARQLSYEEAPRPGKHWKGSMIIKAMRESALEKQDPLGQEKNLSILRSLGGPGAIELT